MKLEYEFTPEQMEKLRVWQEEQDQIWELYQKQQSDAGAFDEPYYGAIGGALTYSFTPTGIGMAVEVTHATGNKLDLTDYDSW